MSARLTTTTTTTTTTPHLLARWYSLRHLHKALTPARNSGPYVTTVTVANSLEARAGLRSVQVGQSCRYWRTWFGLGRCARSDDHFHNAKWRFENPEVSIAVDCCKAVANPLYPQKHMSIIYSHNILKSYDQQV